MSERLAGLLVGASLTPFSILVLSDVYEPKTFKAFRIIIKVKIESRFLGMLVIEKMSFSQNSIKF